MVQVRSKGIVVGVVATGLALASGAWACYICAERRNRRKKVFLVALTGGPCAGKTTCLENLKKAVMKEGYNAMDVPEVPTILSNGGAKYPGPDAGEKLIAFEANLLKLQMQMEDTFTYIAASLDGPSVVVCDRGCMDIAAYLPEPQWKATLRAVGVCVGGLLRRYDAVVHLVTAADGAEKFYTTANNAARRESPEEARTMDRKVKACWAAHPRLFVVDNSTDFDGKVSRTAAVVLEAAKAVFKEKGL